MLHLYLYFYLRKVSTSSTTQINYLSLILFYLYFSKRLKFGVFLADSCLVKGSFTLDLIFYLGLVVVEYFYLQFVVRSLGSYRWRQKDLWPPPITQSHKRHYVHTFVLDRAEFKSSTFKLQNDCSFTWATFSLSHSLSLYLQEILSEQVPVFL